MAQRITVKVLEIKTNIRNEDILLYPALISIGSKNWLVDAGYVETFEIFKTQLAAQGIAIADLQGILISHDDLDHVGGLALFRKAHPDLVYYASEIETPTLTGARKSARLQQAEDLFPQLPEAYHAWALNFQQQLKQIERVSIDVLLKDQDQIAAEIVVIHTPGHTSGHLSFYLPSLKTLIACDVVVIENGQLNIANPAFTLDMPAAVASLQKISQLDIQRLICYHGGEMTTNIAAQLQAVIATYTDAAR
ncbi:MBL fold metallo-hydrolase [Chitinophaga nivalis]|uniref:MBL fold metallo-hydrolase n=1 Tax=Chitinophaga nivalis TaxID=2991709 RepID=A0ABT3IPQ4_9BACT|nr:MBL fold metallo-hydrolase [Chitinophaga nivalis]MCW3464391.1 MBL fold metallo-hydrolase [Chitinophaga nivalis]MCW3485918.1 MBL fold metallo-hydrolase [Chitinophaga nivalis]